MNDDEHDIKSGSIAGSDESPIDITTYLAKNPGKIERLSFVKFVLAGCSVTSTFQDCFFESGVFSNNTISKRRFFGPGCHWRNCVFEDCTFVSSVLLLNRFDRCTFRGVEFQKLLICESAFIATHFIDCRFLSVSAQFNARNLTKRRQYFTTEGFGELARIDQLRTSALFENCALIDSTFDECRFANCHFSNFSVERVHAENCDFSDATGTTDWCRPLSCEKLSIKQLVLELVQELFPENPAAFRAIVECAGNFSDDRFAIEWLDVLLAHGANDNQLDLIERALRRRG